MGSSKKKNTKNQREHKRHFVELGAFAVFSDDNKVIPGQVIDISMGGISFFTMMVKNGPTNHPKYSNSLAKISIWRMSPLKLFLILRLLIKTIQFIRQWGILLKGEKSVDAVLNLAN